MPDSRRGDGSMRETARQVSPPAGQPDRCSTVCSSDIATVLRLSETESYVRRSPVRPHAYMAIDDFVPKAAPR